MYEAVVSRSKPALYEPATLVQIGVYSHEGILKKLWYSIRGYSSFSPHNYLFSTIADAVLVNGAKI